ALDRVRSLNPGGDTSAISLDDPDGGMLLLDSQGLRLSGGTGRGDTGRLGDAAAAEAAGLSREASRTGRLLELGDWQHVMIETTTSRAVLLPVADQCSLLVIRPSLTPPGRSVTIAQRARNAAVEW